MSPMPIVVAVLVAFASAMALAALACCRVSGACSRLEERAGGTEREGDPAR